LFYREQVDLPYQYKACAFFLRHVRYWRSASAVYRW
jgi:hypothetical protein